jgi:hypothetical protein
MEIEALIKAIGGVSSGWSLIAFCVAGLVVAFKGFAVVNHRQGAAYAGPPGSVVWALVFGICFVAALPFAARAYTGKLDNEAKAVYRIKTTVLDTQGAPLAGASLHATATSITQTDTQGVAEVVVYTATLSKDRKVTIYADLDSEFLHGHADLLLTNDLYPQVTIQVKAEGDAVISGLVEDDTHHALPGATVSVLGGDSGVTAANGMFSLKTNAPLGKPVRLHVEKNGYGAVDQDHPAGRGQVTVVLARTPRGKRPR